MNTLFAAFNVNGLNADAKRKTFFNYLKQKPFYRKNRKTMGDGMGKQNRMAAWNKQK